VDVKQINSAIMWGTWTDAELNSMIGAIRFAQEGLRKQKIRSMQLGSTVRWASAKNPRGEQGTVEKIAIKYVTVNTAQGRRWKVPANMLEVV
jgi:hypothetical protein